MYRRIALAILTLSISVHCYAQRDAERRWTDKNNAEQYAAYMIQIAYYERGYMGVRVHVRDDGARMTFEVDPGRIYHIKAMQILGPERFTSGGHPLRRLSVTLTPPLASMNGSLLSRASTVGLSVGVCDAIMQLPIARLKWVQIRTRLSRSSHP